MPVLGGAEVVGAVAVKAATSSVTKKAVTKLINEFSDSVLVPYFSERKAQSVLTDSVKRYLKSCEKRTRFIPTIAIQGSRFLLEDVYEPLELLGKEDRTKFEIKGFPNDLFSESNCILVIDSAGMGKSTLSKFILRSCIANLKLIPIFVELRRVKLDQSVVSFICDEMLGQSTTDACRTKLRECFTHGKFLFIFDGYDEIDDAIRQKVSSDISSISSEYPDCFFWLTSRPDAGLASFSAFRQYHIKPLSREKAHSLLRRYDAGRGKAELLIGKLRGLTQLRDFLGNPLLVTLLYKAYDYKATIPLKRNIFFRQVYDALYQDHDLSKEGAFERRKKSALDCDDFHKALRALGIITFKVGRVQYGPEEFSKLLSEAVLLTSSLKVDIGKWKADLLSAVPVFVKDGTDIRWTHKAFQDYFTAQFVFFDMVTRRERFVNRILSDENPQRAENVLSLLGELDIQVLREGYIRSYLEALLTEAEDAKMASSEANFASFVLQRCGTFFIVTPKLRIVPDVSDLSEFAPILEFLSKKVRAVDGYSQANMSSFHPNAIVGIYRNSPALKQNLLARIDPEAFASPSFCSQFDRKRDLAFIDTLAGDKGWFDVNAALMGDIDEGVKESLLRLSARCANWAVPSLARIRALLRDERPKQWMATLDDLLESL